MSILGMFEIFLRIEAYFAICPKEPNEISLARLRERVGVRARCQNPLTLPLILTPLQINVVEFMFM